MGLALLTLEGDLRPAYGDWLVLGCAVCFALHITAVSAFAPRVDAMALTTMQVATAALLSGAVSLATESWPWPIRNHIWLAAALTGVLATAFAYGVQNGMQTRTTATHTALIFATEPVFAAAFGCFLAGERLTTWGAVGSGLILTGMLLAELGPRPRQRPGSAWSEGEHS
jgi:drug/metabolite transporter (DMT)-like permease